MKADWTKNSEQKIKNHDESVRQNWNKLKRGEFDDLPKDLIAHVKRFTNREFCVSEMPPKSDKQIIHKTKKIHSEFSDIITSYEDLTNKERSTDDQKLLLDKTSQHAVHDIHSRWDKSRKHITLSELKYGNDETCTRSSKTNHDEVLQQVSNTEVYNKDSEQEHHIIDLKNDTFAIQDKFNKSSAGTLANSSKNDYSFMLYPEKINIPKKLYKKGSIYKLNDCYYNHYGTFLYRVPGMVS